MFEGGFRIHPGILERNIDNRFIHDIENLLGAFRDGLGPDTGLMLDINFNQRTEGFLRIARAIEKFDPTWFEIDMHDAPSLAHVRHATNVPIASLESIHGLKNYRPYFEAQAADVAVVDVPWNGLWESVRVATLADAYEVNCAPHNFYGDLATLMSAHFCAAIPNFLVLEWHWIQRLELWRNFVKEGEIIERGFVTVPDRPGIGVEMNEAAVRKHQMPGTSWFAAGGAA